MFFLGREKSTRGWTGTIFLQQVLFFFFLDLDSIPFYHFLTNPFNSTEHNSPGMRGPHWRWNFQPEVLTLLLLLLPDLLLGWVCTHWQQLTHTHTWPQTPTHEPKCTQHAPQQPPITHHMHMHILTSPTHQTHKILISPHLNLTLLVQYSEYYDHWLLFFPFQHT